MASFSVQKFLLLLLSLLVLSTMMLEFTQEVHAREGQRQREFDYFKLALQWPATYCRRTRHCCSSNACCRRANAPTEFTIHGLWPDYNDGTWPACCYRSDFDQKEISTLLDALEKYWPSLSCGSSSTCHGTKGSFWAHEVIMKCRLYLMLKKHGTCSSPVVRDEYNYFLTALNVYFKYNITNVLLEAGYVPSNTEKYPLGGIISAIQNAFRATPSVACSNGAVGELYLCFYKDFKPRDCEIGSIIQDDMNLSKSSCPKYVSLPAFSPSLALGDVDTEMSWRPESEAI
ncbi:Ribonuclease 2 [Turnera subulata]|uniref:Ribonuclease 2 n=1 Tax=Turnera subulata TaxID=218843 RepID=A0A9Q0JPI8_9ROSI|nr:Ribonuclease 2 [Turnera subulata]